MPLSANEVVEAFRKAGLSVGDVRPADDPLFGVALAARDSVQFDVGVGRDTVTCRVLSFEDEATLRRMQTHLARQPYLTTVRHFNVVAQFVTTQPSTERGRYEAALHSLGPSTVPVLDDFRRPSDGFAAPVPEVPPADARPPAPGTGTATGTASTDSGQPRSPPSRRLVRRPLVVALFGLVAAGILLTALVVARNDDSGDPSRATPASGPTPIPTTSGGTAVPKSTGAVATSVPTGELAALVDGALTAEGKRLFYASKPEILDRAAFALACPSQEEATVVLGCFSEGRIYLLRVERADLSRVMQATAAHELLHAGYQALSVGDRAQVDREVGEFYRTLDDPELRDLLSIYERSEPRQRFNELHSILPTTVRSLSGPLEKYYGRYFVSRSYFIDAYEAYKAPFKALKQHADALHAEIADLRGQLDRLDQDINGREATLDALHSRLDAFEAAGDVGSYNALIPEENSESAQIRALIDQYDAVVAAHNDKVAEVDALVLQERELDAGVGSYPEGKRPGG